MLQRPLSQDRSRIPKLAAGAGLRRHLQLYFHATGHELHPTAKLGCVARYEATAKLGAAIVAARSQQLDGLDHCCMPCAHSHSTTAQRAAIKLRDRYTRHILKMVLDQRHDHPGTMPPSLCPVLSFQGEAQLVVSQCERTQLLVRNRVATVARELYGNAVLHSRHQATVQDGLEFLMQLRPAAPHTHVTYAGAGCRVPS
jgi:hypothetical protein